jgi:hypothetical protein
VKVDPVALEFELVDLAFAVVLAGGLEGQDLQVTGKVLKLGQQVSYCHALSVARRALQVIRSWAATGLIGPARNRASNENALPFRPSEEEDLRQPWRTLRRTDDHSYWLCPPRGSGADASRSS